jgi:hypothetical protein
MPFSSSSSTRLESIVSRRSISSVGSDRSIDRFAIGLPDLKELGAGIKDIEDARTRQLLKAL